MADSWAGRADTLWRLALARCPRMRNASLPAFGLPALMVALATAALGGCGYAPIPPDPIRYVTSPTDVAGCRRLGEVGFTRTDGEGYYNFYDLTPAGAGPGYGEGVRHGEIFGRNLAVTIEVMRDRALGLGATDLLLTKRIYRDWSYAGGTAFRCRN